MEVRGWTTRRRGIFALHASRTVDFAAASFYGYENPRMLPLGKIVAVGEITDVVSLESESWHLFLEQHRQPLPMADGSHGFLLKNVCPLEHHVACFGRPNFFPLPHDVAERVRRFAHL